MGGALLAVAAPAAPALAAPVPLSSVVGVTSPAEGTWQTQNRTEITIAPCVSGQGLCGNLSWVVIPKAQAEMCRTTEKSAFASLMMDYQNPDKSLKTRPLLGMEMMQLTPTNDPDAFTASIYNPEDGSTNNVSVWIVNGGNTLRIGGACIGSVCAVTQDWPKVPARPVSPDFTCEGGQ
jgi:uncharacterized protein (DUF2147 family)